MTTMLRRTDEGSTHWIGDDGYPACWRDHRECAEARVERLESALRAVYFIIMEAASGDTSEDSKRVNEACRMIHACLTNNGK